VKLALIFVVLDVGTSEAPQGGETVPRRALAIYAHPDDPDVSCGGTLARWAAAGSEVHVCLCCDGDKGSLDPAVDSKTLVQDRRHETEAAGCALGVAAHHWLGFRDGEVDDSAELRARLVALVRGIRPDAVLAPDPTAVFFGSNYINHRDHRMVGWAVLDAVSPAAANPHYFPGPIDAYQVAVLYLSGTLEPDTWVDITATIETKAAALACHTSQIGVGGEWLGNAVRERAEEAGRLAGVPYAEAFRKVVLA
jgi:LmbE family N-acetylglucosaminyl deacetylase